MTNLLEFEQLCRNASLDLGVQDCDALGQGFSVDFADVLFETAFQDGRDSFLLIAELGAIDMRNRVSVYESLLTVQLMTWNQPALRFGFNPSRQTVVLCVEARFGAHTSASWLATVVRSVAAQALVWRETLLQGKFCASEAGDGTGQATMSGIFARPTEGSPRPMD
ncbi:hypothetical protein [Caenimonas sp. SL110]|uniref:hypothetical protein n=1 Tax=Caenimonas sp. SL110 TaxID=1450524 RepID=UPI000654AC70|nr:hypothetical protein [Caenimonas sp. SL110]